MRLGKQTWEPSLSLNEAIENELTEYYSNPEREGKTLRWSQNRFLGVYKQKIRFDMDNSEITVNIRGHIILYLLFIGLPLGFANAVLSSTRGPEDAFLIFLFLIYSGICYILFTPSYPLSMKTIGILSNQKTNPYAFLTIGWGLLLLWYEFRLFYPSSLIDRFMIVISIIFLGYAFSYDLVPGVSMGLGARIFAIPASALSWLLLPQVLFMVFAFSPGWIYKWAQLHQRNLEKLPPTSTNLNAIRELTGGYNSWDVLVAQRTLTVFQTVMICILLLFILMSIQSYRNINNFNAIEFTPFRSSGTRMMALCGFLCANAGILITLIPAFTVFFYGVFGTFPFGRVDPIYTQAFTAQPVEVDLTLGKTVIHDSEQIGPKELVRASYRALDLTFGHVPYIPARAWSLAFFTLMFIPHIMLVEYWISNLIGGVQSKIALLREGERIGRDIEIVPENIPVLVVDDGDQPSAIAHPVSLLFGWMTYIVISASVRDRLSEEELDAVLAHEVYHIQEHDLKVNAVASIISLGFGGRNALLAFYDYPKIEEEADVFARNNVGLEATIVAIDKMDILAKRSAGWRVPASSPGFVDKVDVVEPRKNLLGQLNQIVKDYSKAPSELLFGRIIFQIAHSDAEARIIRLRNDD